MLLAVNYKYRMRWRELTETKDSLTLPTIDVGDEVLVGKFKNRKATVKGFTTDDHNQPVLKTNKGDQKLFKPRLSKLMTETQDMPDFASMSDQELGAYALSFVEKYAGVRPDFDPEYDEPDERWTGPDSALLQAAAVQLSQGGKPSPVRSDWGSGTYRGWADKSLKAIHDALVREINSRAH